MTYDSGNKMFQLALDLVNQSARNIFLTGKAGTGKTTFLKYIRENCAKQMAVVAPTGVAAINAGGVTIHSFFQLSFAPFLPETKKFSGGSDEVIDRHGLLSRLRLNKEKIKVLEQLELLIIDEVSMVRCDTMDAIDTVLRHVRNRPLDRFGGVQVLFIGDMFQLPPVIKEPEWKLLSEYYNGPYFFNSQVIQEDPPVYIEFTKIYRQSEEVFIRVLNQVRNNQLDEEGMSILEKRFQPSFRRQPQDGYIVLTTHNEKAKDINSRELQNLDEKAVVYKAEIKDEFPENAYPADEVIYLKPGAQVMFIKNDTDKAKRYFNGKIGVVKELQDDKVIVKTTEDEIEVARDTWKNIRYTVNKANRSMDEEELGSFTQFPLRLAWAITIHKSQGLTFEKAIIDAGAAFAAGQVYVALSRCTSLDGMILQSKVRPGSLGTDSRITEFSRLCVLPDALEDELLIARRNYQLSLLIATFNFTAAVNAGDELMEYVNKHSSSFNPDALPWVSTLAERLTALQATAAKFHNWLKAQGQQASSLEENALLQTKTKDGANHFTKEILPVLDLLYQSPVVTDSRLHAKEFNDLGKDVFGELSLKLYLLKGLDAKMDAESWHRKKRSFVLPSFSINAYAGAATTKKSQGPHPVLYDQLRKLRDAICSKKDLPIYLIASSKTIDEMVTYLPQTETELEEITGFGKIKVEKYGQQFLELITQYSKEHNLSSTIAEKSSAAAKPKKERVKKEKAPSKEKGEKLDTKAESFKLFREGLSLADIASTRSLTLQTIEGHLSHYIQEGEVHVEDLLPLEKLQLIDRALGDFKEGSIIPIKEKLGNTISFGDIRMVLAWRTFQNKQGQQSQ